jgi:2',3'-cyclic-nucleotide 2'-phosphodiesterase (5'-nucleotidase family)
MTTMNEFSFTRRRFLTGTGAWLGAFSTGIGQDVEKFRTISIFHTTDLHGHIVPTHTYAGVENVGGFARCATCIRQWRKESPYSLTLDIGDVYQGTAESLINGGNLMIGLFNRLGYDAWTLGNHDFDWGPEALEKNLSLSKPPVLTGNIRVHDKTPGTLEGAWKNVLPWMMREIGGFRIVLIGLVTPGLPYWLAKESLGGVQVMNPLESLKSSIAAARAARADAIIVMGHMGWRNQDDFANPVREILKSADGVDVFLAGHTHQDRPSWKTGEVLCTQAGYYGIHCGRVDLTFDLETRKLIGRKAVTRLMDQSFALDPVVMEMAAPDLKTSGAQLARKLGTVKGTIKCGGRNNPLARFFCDCFADALRLNHTPADGVFHGTFGTGDLTEGVITVADCWKMLPYENLLVTAEVTTEDLIEIIREERRVTKSDRILWPFEIKLDTEGNPVHFTHGDKPVAAGTRFTIAFNSYDAQSGGQSLPRLREILAKPSAKRVWTGIDCRQALMDGILRRGEIS